MALIPQLALMAKPADVGQTFNNALLNLQRTDEIKRQRELAPIQSRLLEAQTTGAEQAVQSQDQNMRLKSIALFGAEIQPDIASGNLASIRQKALNRVNEITQRGGVPNDTQEFIANVLDNPNLTDEQKIQQAKQLADKAISTARQFGVIDNQTSAQFGGTLTVQDADGNLFTQTQRRNPSTGAVESVVVPLAGGPSQPVGGVSIVGSTGETATERQTRELGTEGGKQELTRTTKAVELAIKKGGEAFDRIEPIQTAIGNYDEAIAAIDQGAETGVIASKFPSIKESSIKLDNVVKRMGLDVVGNTTFGALSESELQFALAAAIPTNLKPAELKEWLTAKKRAQQKVLERVQEAASFLSSGDKTLKDWVEYDKARQFNSQASQGGSGQTSSPQPQSGGNIDDEISKLESELGLR